MGLFEFLKDLFIHVLHHISLQQPVLAALQEVEKRELENFLDESFLSEVSAQLRQVRAAFSLFTVYSLFSAVYNSVQLCLMTP